MINKNLEEKVKVDDERFSLLDKRSNYLFATAVVSQIAGYVLYEHCDIYYLNLLAIPLFIVAIISVLYVIYLDSWLDPIKRERLNLSKKETSSLRVAGWECNVTAVIIIIYDVVAMLKIIF